MFVKIDDIIMFRYGELWIFWAPGQGKGTWDCFRGILQNDAKRRKISESSIIQIAAVVYELLHRLFCSEIKEEYANIRRIKVKH